MDAMRMSVAVLALCLPPLAFAAGNTACTTTAAEAVKVVDGSMYTAGAPLEGREVAVQVEATVTADGRASELAFEAGHGLTASAREAVRNTVSLWRFAPATRCGEATAQRVALVVPMHEYASASMRPPWARNATDAPPSYRDPDYRSP